MKLRSILKDKRGLGIGDIYPAIMAIVMVGIVLGVGFYVLSSFRDQMAANSSAYRGVNTTITGLAKFPPWMGIIVVIIAAAVVLGIVIGSFALRGRRGI